MLSVSCVVNVSIAGCKEVVSFHDIGVCTWLLIQAQYSLFKSRIQKFMSLSHNHIFLWNNLFWFKGLYLDSNKYYWPNACSVPSRFLKKTCNIVNWTIGNKFQWNRNQKTTIFIQENELENDSHFVLASCVTLIGDMHWLRPWFSCEQCLVPV